MLKKIIVFFIMILVLFSSNNFTFGNESEKLSVKKIKVISLNKLELTFSNDIFTDKELDFYLKHKEREEDFSNVDSEGKILAISDVKKIDINGNKIYLFPDDKFKNNEEYEIVIISVSDINNNTIESGLDGAIKFTVPADFEEKQREKTKRIIEKINYRKKKMKKILGEVRKELYKVSDIEFETVMEVEEALKIKTEADIKKEKYKKQLEKEKEAEKMEEIRKRKEEEKRKKDLEEKKKKIEEEKKRKEEVDRLVALELKKLEESRLALKKSLIENTEEIELTSGQVMIEENLEGRSIDKVNLEGRELDLNQKAEGLPLAGTREYLIFIFSLMIGGLIFYFRKPKKA